MIGLLVHLLVPSSINDTRMFAQIKFLLDLNLLYIHHIIDKCKTIVILKN